MTAWQTLVTTLLWLYVARNFGKLVGLESPEPLANLYTRPFFRATWFTTALDAGFWSAMHIKRKWARDVLSVVFSMYYLICAEQADEKVRKVRAVITVDHLRIGWNKPVTPFLTFVNKLVRPRFTRYKPRAIRIPRPADSSYTEPVHGWLYFDGPLSALKEQTKVILNVPGGGFVAMSPRTHDDALLAWAGKTGLPILSLDYKKAPEHPYPYALNECYDVYRTLVSSSGRCIGLSGNTAPDVVVSGDSAGGNLATSLVLMVLQAGTTDTRKRQGEGSIPPPVGVVLIYPSLDCNIGSWMTDDQMALIRDRGMRKTNRRIISRKNSDYRKLTPTTPQPSDDEEDETNPPQEPQKAATRLQKKDPAPSLTKSPVTATVVKTRLATPSMISYVNDRVLSPEMMRAMIILYVGPHNRPDFSTDFLLCPVLAPDSLLARFPKTYFITGERDPLVDDTVIMAGRIRHAKQAAFNDRKELGLIGRRATFDATEHVEVKLIEGISHGFIQIAGVFPEAWEYIYKVGRWYEALFELADKRKALAELREEQRKVRHHRRKLTGDSSADDDRPLEMSSRKNGDTSAESVDVALSPQTPAAEGFSRSSFRRSSKSLVSLASEDDLLGRRMSVLTQGLTKLH